MFKNSVQTQSSNTKFKHNFETQISNTVFKNYFQTQGSDPMFKDKVQTQCSKKFQKQGAKPVGQNSFGLIPNCDICLYHQIFGNLHIP